MLTAMKKCMMSWLSKTNLQRHFEFFRIPIVVLLGFQFIGGCTTRQGPEAFSSVKETHSESLDLSRLASKKKQIVVLFVSDLHGRLRPGVQGLGGYSRLGGLIAAHKKNAGDRTDVLAIVGGDIAGKGAIPCQKSKDRECFPFLGMMGFDIGVFGNGELKRNKSDLDFLLKSSGIDWINSNTEALRSSADTTPLWTPIKVYDGPKSGLSLSLVSWTIPPAPEEVDFSKLGFRVRLPEPENEVNSLVAKLPKDKSILWLPHQSWAQDQKTLKAICQNSSLPPSVALLKSNDHVSRRLDKNHCIPLFEPGAFGEFVLRLFLEPNGSEGTLRIVHQDFVPVDSNSPVSEPINLAVEKVYQRFAPEADKTLLVSVETKPLKEFAERVADAFRQTTRADIAIVNRGAIKGDLPSGVLNFEGLSFLVPYNDPLVGLDWKFKDFEKSLCQASQRRADEYLDNGSELFFSGMKVEGMGTPDCKVVLDRPKGQVKVVMAEYVAKRSERWLGKNLRSVVFRFGVDAHRAISLQAQRSGGKL